MATQQAETFAFQAEVSQVLSLVVNSLYAHREVFLRELLSNASDALDHLSFRAVTEPEVMGDDKDLEIRIAVDTDARTIAISDNGIGMTHDELVKNLGTIAQSGTRELAAALREQGTGDAALIGQFGVGFYSGFLVAERVSVTSRAAASDEAWCWSSDGATGFTVEGAERQGRGTDVVLHLRDDEELGDFLRDWTLRELVRKYSDYVRHPIRLRTEKPTDPKGDENGETTVSWEQVNRGAALWTRPRSEVEHEQYVEFYKHLTHDWEEPLGYRHFKVEGMQELGGILFVPKRPAMDFASGRRKGMRLFVRRVFVMDDCEELMPEWLRFMRGVVDSDDLPLNVSREFLQKDRTTAAIRKQIVRQAIALLEEMAGEDSDTDYEAFWNSFGAVLKEGVHYEPKHKDKIAKLLRYHTSADRGLVSLEQYIEHMPAEQDAIYYVTAQSQAAAAGSPQIEALRAREYEVLYMTDPVDEWVVESLPEFREKKLVSAAKGALDLPESDEDKQKREEQTESLAGLAERMQTALSEHVQEVRVSTRLTDSPACLVVDEGGMAPHIERMLRAHQRGAAAQQRILEVNPDHPVIEHLRALAGDDDHSETVDDWSRLLFDQALVAEGSPPTDPSGFARRITSLLTRAIG